MSIFSGYETISNHGTSSGIIPRFFDQPMEIASYALGKAETDDIFGRFLKKNIADFTDFYDLYHEILKKYTAYKTGLQDGTYFSIGSTGEYRLDRSLEFEFHRKIKDFYILGRLLINNFSKSKIVDSEHFKLSSFILVNDKNFEKNKEIYFQNEPSKKFEVLIKILEKGRHDFLNTFNQIRADFEHENLEIPNFSVNTQTGEYTEPGITESGSLIEEVTFCYNSILAMLERLIVYHYGILAVEKYKIMGLYIREEFDYSKLLYKYVLLPRMEMEKHKLIM